jgi:hypothetical protein
MKTWPRNAALRADALIIGTVTGVSEKKAVSLRVVDTSTAPFFTALTGRSQI